ncbi:hypothetical protein WICPIJ_002030 [Wickerhamomyces pijperi]|uniref:Uncharacterized protein n=1 Tax=Wickerhamomyces pijperi TaxID=599730 RepID=A0A9P8TQ74_WICPI|nr:hypothetical protein WICPIJ_002030 [Wickerhamomyces pijperi]
MSTISRITTTLHQLQARDDSSTLPTLTTSTTAADTTTADTTTTDATSSMPVLSLPKISATTSTTTHAWVTPTITPPSAASNPNIWRSSAPEGTVFIAFGAIAGSAFLALFIFLILRRWWADRNTRTALSFDSDAHERFLVHEDSNMNLKASKSSDKISNPFLSSSKSDSSDSGSSDEHKYPQLYDKSGYNDSVTNVSDAYLKAPENFYSTLELQGSNNKRKSMFVSPTAEVMHLRNQVAASNLDPGHPNSTNSSVTGLTAPVGPRNSRVFSTLNSFAAGNNDSGSLFSSHNGSTVGAAVPAQRLNNHKRDISMDSVTLQSPDRSQTRGNNRHNKNVPSVYLDSMFEDDDDQDSEARN